MNTIIYGITEETYRTKNSSRTAYGIAAYADPETDGTAAVVASVRDISADREKVEILVCECNRLAVSPCHLTDIVEDFLAL